MGRRPPWKALPGLAVPDAWLLPGCWSAKRFWRVPWPLREHPNHGRDHGVRPEPCRRPRELSRAAWSDGWENGIRGSRGKSGSATRSDSLAGVLQERIQVWRVMPRRDASCDAQCACSHAAHAVAAKCMPDALIGAAVKYRFLMQLHMLPLRRCLRLIWTFASESKLSTSRRRICSHALEVSSWNFAIVELYKKNTT